MTARATRTTALVFAASGPEPEHQAQGPGGCWVPAVDVYRISSGWVVKADLAGVRPEDTHIAVDGRRLTIRGVRRDRIFNELLCSGQECVVERMEIAYSAFERTIELPSDLSGADVAAATRDGMLLLTIRPPGGPGT
jgi:HSP20 family protein